MGPLMGPLVGKIIVDIARTVGKAVLAGVGLELAKVASDHLRKRLGPTKTAEELEEEKQQADPEAVRAENAKLKAEVDRLRDELATARAQRG